MASAAVQEQEEDHQCPVCSDWFTQPKLLSCGHLLCRRCLLSWIQTQPHAGCPLCRCAIVDPEERAQGSSLEDVVDSFPTDLFMEAWVESHQLLSEDHHCQSCVKQAATSICTTCRDLLCASCATIHRRMSMTRHHTVEKLSVLTPEKLMSSRPSFCSSHGDKMSEVYCPTHGASICLLCATTEHRQCPDVTKLKEKMEEARTALADMRANLREEGDHLDHAVQQLDQHLQDMQQKVKVSAAEIEAMCQSLEASVKACQKRLNHLLHDVYEDVKEAVSEAKTWLSEGRGRVRAQDRVLERGEGASSANDVLGMVWSLKRRVDSLHVSCTLPPEAKVVSTFSLVLDQEAVARVKKELSMIGQLQVLPAQGLPQPGQNPGPSTCQPAVLTFHDQRKGKHVVLSNNQQTAERRGHTEHGIVLSCDPMEVNCLYQVRVDQIANGCNNSDIYLGVVTQTRDTVTLPYWSGFLTSAVVVSPNCVIVNTNQTETDKWSSLSEVREGGRVGLMLDNSRTLHLYIEGRPLGQVTSHLPHPCFFMVDIGYRWSQVTALPVQRMK